MKRVAFALALLAVSAVPSLLHAEDGVIDLATLPNYARQAKPAYINRDNTPLGPVPAAINPISNTGATLGRLLFYDKRLSRNDTVSCSSCHQQSHAFSNPAIAPSGVAGTTPRHAMRLVNARFSDARFFWDDRAPTLEDQATQPLKNAIEMGFSGTNGDPNFSDLLAKLSALPEYQLLFKVAFGSSVIDEPGIQRALSQFIRSIQSFDSKFDAGAAVTNINQPFPNFTDSENRGKQLFLTPDVAGGANCSLCHLGPEFANALPSGNNGVITAIDGGTDLNVITSPTLRDLFNPNGQLNGPLMHNASFTSIQQVINHYAAIPGDNVRLSPFLKRTGVPQTLNLTTQQRLDLEAFLMTLSGKNLYTDPKWSNPFRPDGTITVIDTSLPAAQTVNLSTRMRVLTGDKVGIGGFIITGTAPKRVLVRALGPSLAPFGLTNLLTDPRISLNGPAGFTPIVNDNWRSSQENEITATGLAPGNDLESAIIATLAPGSYTAVLSGTNAGIGSAILEIYDLDFAAPSKLANISTRAFVGTGDDILIAGFTVGNANSVDNIIVRGLGPSLTASSLDQVLLNPTLDVRDANGASLVANDNWRDNPQAGEIIGAGLGPSSFFESAVAITVGPGAYTALLSAAPGGGFPNPPSNPGIGLVEVYSRGRVP
jgi:cytochrome c peroxidase